MLARKMHGHDAVVMNHDLYAFYVVHASIRPTWRLYDLNLKLHMETSAVWQIELSSLIFGKNVKNTPPTVWQKTWQLGKNQPPARKYTRAARSWHRGF